MAIERNIPRRFIPRTSRNRVQKEGKTRAQMFKEQKREKEFNKEIERVAKDNISSINNISEISSVKNKVITTNAPNLNDFQLIQLRNALNKAEKEILQAQKSQIDKLKSNLNTYDNLRLKYDKRSKKAKKEGDMIDFADERAKEEKYIVKINETEKIIQRLEKGERLDQNSIDKFVNDKARQEEKQLEAQLLNREFKKQQITFDDNKVNKVVQDLAQKYSTNAPDNKTIENAYKAAGITPNRQLILETSKVLIDFEKQKRMPVKPIDTRQSKKLTMFDKAIIKDNEKILEGFSVSSPEFNYAQSKKPTLFTEALAKKGDLSSNQFLKFQKLEPNKKIMVSNYVTINTFKNSLPSLKELKEIEKFNIKIANIKNLKTDKNVNEFIKNAGKFSNINLGSYKTLNLENIGYLSKLTNKELQNIYASNDQKSINKINKALKEYDKFTLNANKITNWKLRDYFNSEYDKVVKSAKTAPVKVVLTVIGLVGSVAFPALSFVGVPISIGLIKSLADQKAKVEVFKRVGQKIKNNSTLTSKEYEQFNSILNDTYGIKELRRNFILNKNNRKGFEKYVKTISFIGKSGFYTGKELLEDYMFIFNVSVKVIKTVGKKVVSVPFSLGKDFAELTYNYFKKVPKDKRNKEFKYIQNEFKGAIKAYKTVSEVQQMLKQNPQLLGILVGTVSFDLATNTRKEIIKNPAKAVGYVASYFAEELLLGGAFKLLGLGARTVSVRKYISALPDADARKFAKVIIKATKKTQKVTKTTRVDSIRFLDDIVTDKNIRRAIYKAQKDTNSRLYGSTVEYLAGVQEFAKRYESEFGVKVKNYDDLINKLSKLNTKYKKSDIEKVILGKPGDLDLFIEPRFVKKQIDLFNKKYDYIPDLAKSYYQYFVKKNKNFKDPYKFGIELIRKDKSSVLSILKESQIDTILREMKDEPVTAIFKVIFLENLYKTNFPKSKFRSIKLDQVLEIGNFGVDIHTSKAMVVTKKWLGINFKKKLPLEYGKRSSFKKEIIKNTKAQGKLIAGREKAYNVLTEQVKPVFKSYGFNISGSKLEAGLTKFLEKSELRAKETFDFLETLKKKKVIDKKVLEKYYQVIDFAKFGINKAKFKEIVVLGTKGNDVNKDIKFLEFMLELSKRGAKINNKFNNDLAELVARRELMIYYSSGAKKGIYRILKFDDPTFKLKKELNIEEQNKLVNIIEKADNFIQNEYSFNNINKYFNLNLKPLKEKSKQIVSLKSKKYNNIKDVFRDLGKTFVTYNDGAFIKGDAFKTGVLLRTKEGFNIIQLPEQIGRRGAGGLSDMFGGRRAKDIKKLYNNVRRAIFQLEDDLRKLDKKPGLLGKINLKKRKIKKDIEELTKLSNKLIAEDTRKYLDYTTKGNFETIDFKKIDVNKAIKDADEQLEGLIKTNKELLSYKKSIEIAKRNKKEIERFQALLKSAKRSGNVSKKAIITASVLKLIKFYKKGSLYRSVKKSISSSKGLSKVKSVSVSKSKSKSKSTSKSKSKSPSKSKSKSPSKSKSKSASRSKSRSVSKSKSPSRSLSKSKSPSTSRSKSPSPSPSKSKRPSIIPGIKLPKFKLELSWKQRPPRGQRYKVDGFVKVGKRKVKVVSGLPVNKAWNTVFRQGTRKFRSVDKSVARSFEFRIVGLTKAKDDKTKLGLRKVRRRIGKDPKVLKIVEKSKFAIDTQGEKQGLKLRRGVKRGTTKRSSTKRRTKRIKTKKKVKTKTKKKQKTMKVKTRTRAKKVKRKK